MRLSIDKIRCVKVSMWEEEDLYSYIFPILRFHGRWNELKAEDYRYAIRKPRVTYDGYIMSFERPEKVPQYDKMELDSYAFPDKSVEYLKKIMEYCREKDISLLLMKTPTFINNWFPEYDEQLLEMSKEYENCDYINFDFCIDKLGLDPGIDYVDGHSHMNLQGAEKFSDYFGGYIKESYDLPDHRQDSTYSNVWNDKYTRYSIDRKKGKAALQ